jgi:membrane protein DedA with SNARE-associated domain
LHFIHLFASDPDTADRKSKQMFARHGPPLLVLDKFVPGLDAVVPPLAGTSGTGRILFLLFETLGATLWAIAYTGLGYVFSHDLDRAAAYVGRAGTILVGLVLGAVSILAARALARWHRRGRKSERTPADPVRHGGSFGNPSASISGLEHGD